MADYIVASFVLGNLGYADFVVLIILAGIIGGIVYYLYRAKKRGETCIGCPYAKQCGSSCSGQCDNQQAGRSDNQQASRSDSQQKQQ